MQLTSHHCSVFTVHAVALTSDQCTRPLAPSLRLHPNRARTPWPPPVHPCALSCRVERPLRPSSCLRCPLSGQEVCCTAGAVVQAGFSTEHCSDAGIAVRTEKREKALPTLALTNAIRERLNQIPPNLEILRASRWSRAVPKGYSQRQLLDLHL